MKAMLAVLLLTLTACGDAGKSISNEDFRNIPIRGVSAGDPRPTAEEKLRSEFSTVECLEDGIFIGSSKKQLWTCRSSGQNDSIKVIFNEQGLAWNIRYNAKIDHGNSSACEQAQSTTKDEILSRYGTPHKTMFKVMMYEQNSDSFSADISCNDFHGAVGGQILHVSLALNVISIMDSQADTSNGARPKF